MVKTFDDEFAFKSEVENIIEENYIVDKYCPHCETHCNHLKLYTCSDTHYYRCIRCLGLSFEMMLPVKIVTDRPYRSEINPNDLRAYADKVEARQKEQEEEKEKRTKKIKEV